MGRQIATKAILISTESSNQSSTESSTKNSKGSNEDPSPKDPNAKDPNAKDPNCSKGAKSAIAKGTKCAKASRIGKIANGS